MSKDDYRYRELPLTPAIIEQLIADMYSGRRVTRQEIIENVPRTHELRGGVRANAQSTTSSVKRALQRLAARGLAQNVGYGYWQIDLSAAAEAASSEEPAVAEQSSNLIATSEENSRSEVIERVIGSGTGAIYVYYLPMYEQRAKERGESTWPCKIGRTDRDPLERILAQAATALPERPVVAIVFRTHTPQIWESTIHGVLVIRGRRLANAPGAEWFVTSPEEVLAIVKAIDPALEQELSADVGPVRIE